MIREYEAKMYVGAAELLDLLESAGWVKPSIRRHKLKLYDRNLIDAALDRLALEELPSDGAQGEASA